MKLAAYQNKGEKGVHLVEPIRDKKQIEAIRNYLYNYQYMYGLIWELSIYSGLRIYDILNLPITVKDKKEVTIIEKKTKKLKTFPIPEELQEKIRIYISAYRRYELGGNKHLFVGKKHKKLDKSQVYRNINRVCSMLGITVNVGCHTMRKTFGYHHYKQFHDVAILQHIFNHSSPVITLRYIGITQDEINDSYKNFSYGIEENSETNTLDRQRVALAHLEGEYYKLYDDNLKLKALVTELIKQLEKQPTVIEVEKPVIVESKPVEKEIKKIDKKPVVIKTNKGIKKELVSLKETIDNYIAASYNERNVNFCKWLLEQAEANAV